jgi:hypothetical protein
VEKHVFLTPNAAHAHTADAPTLAEIEAASLLAVANAANAHTGGVPTITVLNVLFAANLAHAVTSSQPQVLSSGIRIIGPIRRPSITHAKHGRTLHAHNARSIHAG